MEYVTSNCREHLLHLNIFWTKMLVSTDFGPEIILNSFSVTGRIKEETRENKPTNNKIPKNLTII